MKNLFLSVSLLLISGCYTPSFVTNPIVQINGTIANSAGTPDVPRCQQINYGSMPVLGCPTIDITVGFKVSCLNGTSYTNNLAVSERLDTGKVLANGQFSLTSQLSFYYEVHSINNQDPFSLRCEPAKGMAITFLQASVSVTSMEYNSNPARKAEYIHISFPTKIKFNHSADGTLATVNLEITSVQQVVTPAQEEFK